MPISMTQAWAEAVVTVPKDRIPLPTLEIHHSQFLENGIRTAVRLVRNTEDITARLEVGALLNSGELVTFLGVPFEIDFPRIGPLGVTSNVTIDNINKEVSKYLQAAIVVNEPIIVICRGYVSNDLNTVGQGPYKLELRAVKRKGSTITGSLMVASPGEQKFLRKVYGMLEYPSLMAAS